MKKALIVIDLPDDLDEHDIPELLCNVKVTQDDEYIFSRHFLKLKPIPTRVMDRNTFAIENKHMNYQDGYNACLDEILEGEE